VEGPGDAHVVKHGGKAVVVPTAMRISIGSTIPVIRGMRWNSYEIRYWRIFLLSPQQFENSDGGPSVAAVSLAARAPGVPTVVAVSS